MKKSKKVFIKCLAVSFIAITGIYISYSFETTELNTVEANLKPKYAEQLIKPVHAKYYKMGEANDIEMSLSNYEKIAKTKRKERQIKIAEKREAEEKQAAKELAEKEKQTTSSKKKEVVLAQSSSEVDTTDKEEIPEVAATVPEVVEPKEATQPVQPNPAPAQKPTPAPAPKPQASAIGSNRIGINGIYHSYTNYGRATTDQFQEGIDAGLIVAGFTHFNGNDNETTYFGGHNPGIMKFMENNIHIGATVTVTDGSGQAHNYKMIDKVDVDEYGEGVLTSIGRSAIDVYMYGTGTESILIQFCNTNNYLMSFWYGVKI